MDKDLFTILTTVFNNISFGCVKETSPGDRHVSFKRPKFMFDREKLIFFFFFWGGGGVYIFKFSNS